jgi:hypothetical protein
MFLWKIKNILRGVPVNFCGILECLSTQFGNHGPSHKYLVFGHLSGFKYLINFLIYKSGKIMGLLHKSCMKIKSDGPFLNVKPRIWQIKFSVINFFIIIAA